MVISVFNNIALRWEPLQQAQHCAFCARRLHRGQDRTAALCSHASHLGVLCIRRGQGGDHMIARDVTALFTEGWDWMQPVRDRDTGVFDSVELALVGPVALQDPGVVVDQLQGLEAAAAGPAPGPGFPAAAAAARLSGEVTFVSAGAAPLRGVLVASVAEAPHAGLRGGAATPCASYLHD
jgi:hypothetical protein